MAPEENTNNIFYQKAQQNLQAIFIHKYLFYFIATTPDTLASVFVFVFSVNIFLGYREYCKGM